MGPADWLAAEALIIARLREAVPGFRVVMGVGDLARISEATQQTPGAHVIYQGEKFGVARGGRGEVQTVIQQWSTIVAVTSAVDLISGEGNRTAAGPLIAQTIAALAGHQLSEAYRPLVRVPALPPSYSGEYAYFPIAWELSFIGA